MTFRVVSLVPSSTETLLALGGDVVACTKFCEQPALRTVGGTKNPDIKTIVALGPDLVVLDREENRIEDHDALVAAGLTVFVSDVRSVDAGIDVVDELAAVLGVPTLARPEIPIADVAISSGFYDQSAFARQFKAITGLTPREFRNLPRRK